MRECEVILHAISETLISSGYELTRQRIFVSLSSLLTFTVTVSASLLTGCCLCLCILLFPLPCPSVEREKTSRMMSFLSLIPPIWKTSKREVVNGSLWKGGKKISEDRKEDTRRGEDEAWPVGLSSHFQGAHMFFLLGPLLLIFTPFPSSLSFIPSPEGGRHTVHLARVWQWSSLSPYSRSETKVQETECVRCFFPSPCSKAIYSLTPFDHQDLLPSQWDLSGKKISALLCQSFLFPIWLLLNQLALHMSLPSVRGTEIY